MVFIRFAYICICSALVSCASIQVTKMQGKCTEVEGVTFDRCEKIISFIDDELVEDKDIKYSKNELVNHFRTVTFNPGLLKLMITPGEAKPWHEYQKSIITERKISDGAQFFRQYRSILEETAKKYGVSEYIIVATLGIETNYGANQGNSNTLEALANLAFNYPQEASNAAAREIFCNYSAA